MDDRLHKIEMQLVETLGMLSALTEKVEERINMSKEWRARTDRALWGDGNGVKGIITRMDRAEQSLEAEKWMKRRIMGAVIGLVVVQAAAFLFRR